MSRFSEAKEKNMAAKTALPKNVTVAKLHLWGYFPEYRTSREALNKMSHKRYLKAVGEYQARNRLKTDGIVGPVTARRMARRFCNVPDFIQKAGQEAKWNHKDVTYCSTVKLRQNIDVQAVVQQVAAHINSHCGINHTVVTQKNRANIYATGATSRTDRHLDGPSGTLGYAYFPPGNNRPNTQITSVFDQDEPWSTKMLFLVKLHEWLHSDGVPHNENAEVCLMDPYLNMDLDGLQEWDIAELVKRYGKPSVVTPPQPPVVPPGSPPHVDITVTVGGVKFVAAGNTRPEGAIQAVRKRRKAGVLS